MQSYLGGRESEDSRAPWKRVFRAYSSFFRCDSSSVSRPDPIVSISSSTNIGQAREKGEKGRGGVRGERIVGGKSNMVDGKVLSNKIPRIYTGRGAETICLAGRTPFPRQENRLPVFLLLHGLFQACFPYG